ncbi:hypothetical protein [Shewanella surugensis]|uniref:Light-harvesting protein n=1 Tax=Shewanella surugensis TaxID=212020 RepID=A0ABT0LKL9_9GAMM|nr:hypothetical protein [Shewanella surugensis]MCL1128025.1 hypothetical protein [Shewanella surugensis]
MDYEDIGRSIDPAGMKTNGTLMVIFVAVLHVLALVITDFFSFFWGASILIFSKAKWGNA